LCALVTLHIPLESQAVESGYNAEHDESSSTVSFCRLGDLFLNYQHEGEGNTDNVISVNGDCQTNMLGPGFHKAAIEFIDRLQQATGTRFEVEDETDYYTERDFEAMKKKHFHKWLAKLFEIIQEQEDKGSTSLSICWDLNKYYPQSDSGIVISPLGSFRLSEVIRRIREEGIESFADDFFIWNNPERDARFHRGLALNAMWEDCYFMPSERSEEDARINGYIISELETAASLDPSLPFPKKEYEELCRLHGCTPVPTDGIPTYETEFAIGYRRGIINHKVGRIRFSLPGSYLEDTDDGTLVYYDAAADNWHTVRCTGYSTNGEPDFLDVEEEMIEEREFDGGKYRLYDMGIGQDSEDEEPYPVYSCHALCSNQYTLFTLCASRLEDPSLIIYAPVRVLGNKTIVTNGDQTDTIYDGMDNQLTFEQSLRSREFEPDGPNYTPRISGVMHIEGGRYHYAMSILKSNHGDASSCVRNTFAYETPLAGEGHFIHTYMHDGNPLPSFEGEPKRVAIEGDIDSFSAMLWDSLNEDNKVSLFVRFIDIETGKYETRIINKNQK